jgi:hypothetical protein
MLETMHRAEAEVLTGYALHYGRSKKPLLFVVPDSEYPAMYRVLRLDGQLSGMLNLTRARETGNILGARIVPAGNQRLLRWETVSSLSWCGL